MLNEHDIKDMILEAWGNVPQELLQVPVKDDLDGGVQLDFMPFMSAFVVEFNKLLASRLDKAWYYDAANLVRKMSGIPVSLMGPCSAHAKDNYEEGL